ncbi:hypothetical protein Cni_G21018 [Canna indica]|uniref:Germin-like protein n=1 Tax=Canna indica TaxID=4628 RepID=A0AAQ3KNR1_9LILI|nr:hypothetical protein Cni_G21018 [Canna indica]
MAAAKIILIAALIAFMAASHGLAADPGPLQDYCVADYNSTVFVNGYACKDRGLVTADDFFFSGLDKRASTANRLGSNITIVDATKIPGVNSLGVSMSRIDYAPYGLNPPHAHPRSSEILHVVEGELYAGFVSANTEDGSNLLFAKKLRKGDVFVFPRGLIHFQFNCGGSRAVAFAAFDSQKPGLVTIANAMFGAHPAVDDEVLVKAFQLNEATVDWLQKQNWLDVST